MCFEPRSERVRPSKEHAAQSPRGRAVKPAQKLASRQM